MKIRQRGAAPHRRFGARPPGAGAGVRPFRPPRAGALHPEEKRSLLGIAATVAVLHAAGWGALFGFVLPQQQAAGGNAGGLLALGLGAYALGIRHAFDADHIAAIDNATRRMVGAGRRPLTTGLWFALGHSSVVVAAVVLLLLGTDAFAGALADEGSALRRLSAVWGGLVSGFFLILVGVLNLSAFRGLRGMLRRARSGELPDAELDIHLERRGLLVRVLRPLAGLIDRPVKMYPVGFLFGLGLDTAASVVVFVVAAGMMSGLPPYSVLVMPALFTAGMALFDSADGVLMHRVYRWASESPYRKLRYNLVVTAVSVLVAFVVGGTGLLTVASDLAGESGGPLSLIAGLNLEYLGIGLVLLFFLLWAAAALRTRTRTKHRGAGSGSLAEYEHAHSHR